MTETTEVSRSHAPRGNACLDAQRRVASQPHGI
jgi:hypothetical protein